MKRFSLGPMLLVILGLAISGILTAAFPVHAADQERIFIYTPLSDFQMNPVIKGFNEIHPNIKVEYIAGGIEEIYAMVDLELRTGQVQGDVMFFGDEVKAQLLKKHFITYRPTDLEKVVDRFVDPEGVLTPYGIDGMLIQYNTKYISKDEAPKSFAEALNPKFKNKMSYADPRLSGAVHMPIYLLTKHLESKGKPYGWGYYEELAKLNPLIVGGHGAIKDYVEKGERPLGPEQSISLIVVSMKSKEYTDYTIPKEGVPVVAQTAAIFRSSKHIEASKKFIDFLVSEKGQQLITGGVGFPPVRKGMPFKLPHGEKIEDLDLIPLGKFLTPEVKAKQADTFHRIIKQFKP